jgi:hypothetical protein
VLKTPPSQSGKTLWASLDATNRQFITSYKINDKTKF